ncbi:MAG: hypothetical protein PHH70_01780 [Candidatus Gracilibacteria bacterium]|nr:hypothetical protein [Candidatus Gracilibacteria bacterium]
MKKKIASLVLLAMYFFGGIGMVLAASVDVNQNDGSYQTLENKRLGVDDGSYQRLEDKRLGTSSSISSPAPSGGPNDMTSPNFSFDVSSLSPSEKSYKDGTRINLKNILSNIGRYLLIATTTIAVLSLVIGGLMISTTGPSDRAAKGKTIIVLNITAIVIALLSYSIIRLVSWLIA